MRLIVIIIFILLLTASLFKLRDYFEDWSAELQNKMGSNVSEKPAEVKEPVRVREFDAFVLKIIRTWDFDAFSQSLSPEVKDRQPEPALRALFQGIAYRLGPLVYYRGSRFSGESLLERGSRSEAQTLKVEAAFVKGEAAIEIDVRRSETGFLIERFEVESEEIEGVEDAARSAYNGRSFDTTAFRERIAQ